ncbi:MAG: toxin-antitoxin system antitoxin subunit [Eisenbergiella massiliensis]
MEAGLPFVRKLSRYNVETEAAMQEEGDIINGDISIKSYPPARELFAESDAEIDGKRCYS